MSAIGEASAWLGGFVAALGVVAKVMKLTGADTRLSIEAGAEIRESLRREVASLRADLKKCLDDKKGAV